MKPMTTLVPTLLVILLAGACSKETAVPAGGEKSATAAVPESFWSAQEPAGALPIAQVHATAKDGERVVLLGRVGGDAQVFFENTGVFTLVDAAMVACSDEGDPMAGSCETPWDYCCADRKALLQSTATVELRQDGKVISQSPKGFHGLDHLSTVVVDGTAERDALGNLVVAARTLHVREDKK